MTDRDPERRALSLSDKQIDEIAEKAAVRAVEMMKAEFYKEVGKSIVSKFFLVVGMAATGLVIALQKGWKPFG